MKTDYSAARPFQDLWGIILGGSSGFGLASVRKLASAGMNLVVLYRDTSSPALKAQQEFKKLEQDFAIRILSFNENALDKKTRDSCIQTLTQAIRPGSVKVLVHSIARGNLKPLITHSESDAATETDLPELSAEDIALTGYAMCSSLLDWARAIFRAALFCPDARVIGLTSQGAHTFWQGYAAVSMAKSSLESLIKYMAVEFARFGLKANLIQAGITETPSLKRIADSGQLIAYAENRNPMGRMTRPEDVAGVIYLLCTPEAFWINGALIHVDGGEHCL
jgi:enoyl-[acyl-carrier protein] reductase III